MSNLNETIRTLMPYVFAIFIVGLCFWFLYAAFLDVNTATLPQEQQTVFVAGLFGILGSATTFVFTQSSAGAASRNSERAASAATQAALTAPPTGATITAPNAETVTVTDTAPETTTAGPPPMPPQG